MSRYANRLVSPPSSSRYGRRVQDYYEDRPGQGYRGGVAGPEEDDDDDTAVATDVSNLPTNKRGVSFGPDEIEEFHGSEAPDAVPPARSRSRMDDRPAQGRPPSSNGLAPPIHRPRSTSLDGRRSAPSPSPSQAMMPPPPVPSPRRAMQSPVYAHGRDRGYNAAPVSFTRSHGYDDAAEEDEGIPSDDDDAFTAVATGVATDLDLDEPLPQRGGGGGYPAMRHAPAQVRRSPYPSPAPPPPPPNSHARFASVHTQYPRSTSASGYDSSYFDGPGEYDALPFRGYGGGGERGGGQLAPPRTIARPASAGSMRMQVDEGVYEDGIRRGGTPGSGYGAGRRGAPVAPAVPEDSPVEKELIALLKELQFSLALKDFHDTMKVGVQKTLVAEDGMGHAYCKVHCKKLPRHEDIAREPHLRNHWIPIAGSRWEFRTASHRVTVVFKTAALAAYEAQFLTHRP
ncbi:hypothetical protein JCM5296_005155 [Sporobolomyces johnsonii]